MASWLLCTQVEQMVHERFVAVLREWFPYATLTEADAVRLARRLVSQLPDPSLPDSSVPIWCNHLRFTYSHKQQQSVWFFTAPGQQPQAIAEGWTVCPICQVERPMGKDS